METHIDFSKYADGLVPAIAQDSKTGKVLMLGFMNKEAFDKTMNSQRLTFFSRSKKRLWTKGEESGNYLNLHSYAVDCDNDSLLFQVVPEGPVCHTGADTCWNDKNTAQDFLAQLESIIQQRKLGNDAGSYVKTLLAKGINKVAQKVGEEAVELVIEAKDNNDQKFLDEAADLLFHYLLLLNSKGYNLESVKEVLQKRHKS